MDSGKNDTKENTINEEKRLEIKEKLGEVDRQLMTMEWDKRHNQFNPGMEDKYRQLKEEHDTLTKKLNGESA